MIAAQVMNLINPEFRTILINAIEEGWLELNSIQITELKEVG